MSLFNRDFGFAALEKWLDAGRAGAIGELLERWSLPGEAPSSERQRLRLAVRNGYLNFYAKGQSVAKLSMPRGEPRLEIHRAYLGETVSSADDYHPFTGSDLRDLGGDDVDGWVAAAERHAGAEKRFVDELVRHNPGVIDLEMGLPADGKSKTAPRMDLILVQPGGESLELAFWEAKCSINPELRSSTAYSESPEASHTGPRVIRQLRNYVAWIDRDAHRSQVVDAYRKAARIMLALSKLVDGRDRDTACTRLWKQLCDTPAALVMPPAIVIGNYCPANHEGDAEAFSNAAISFSREGAEGPSHRRKLQGHGITVVEIEAGGCHVLPALEDGAITL